MNRRTFLKAGLAGSVLLAGAGYVTLRNSGETAAGMRFLTRGGLAVITALVPVVLADTLPEDAGSRAVAVNDVVEAFDRAVAGMTPAVQQELAELLGLLAFAPTRCLVAGVWSDWPGASPDAVRGFLERWRGAPLGLLRAGYQALTQLILAGWYGSALAWGRIAYIPPEVDFA